MSRKTSSKWIDRQVKDPFVKQRNQLSARSRAFFKLVEINDKKHFIKKGYKVIDMGAAPGGWSEAACEIIGSRGHILSIDSIDFKSVRNGTCLKIDCLDACLEDKIKKVFVPGSVDVVMSDMAASSSGHKKTDHLRIMALCETAAYFAFDVLEEGGTFVAKVLAGGAESDLQTLLKQKFTKVYNVKPLSSRSDSSEKFVVALGFRG